MRTGLTNNRNVLTATTHRSAATPMYLQYPKYVVGVECALHMAYKHLICKCKNLFAFAEFQFANLMIIPLPPLAEQKRIVAKLEEILPLCERLK